MSNIRPDDLRRQAAEDEFFRLAAMEIESEQNEAFLEAQSLPDPPPEVLQRMQANLQQTMRKTKQRKRRHIIFMHLGRLTACAAIVCCVLISGTYLSVDAARDSINNFVLELFDDHSIIKTENSKFKSGSALPADWQEPFYITWVPTRFINVHINKTDSVWSLFYQGNSEDETLSIYVWDFYHSPNINTENVTLIEEENIQGSLARIYLSEDGKTCMLIWTKENYIVQIFGVISSEEAIKIAESFVI